MLCISVPYAIIAVCYFQILRKIRKSKMKIRELQTRQISVQSEVSVTPDSVARGQLGQLGVPGGALTKSPSMLQLDQLHRSKSRQQERKEWRVTVMIGLRMVRIGIMVMRR